MDRYREDYYRRRDRDDGPREKKRRRRDDEEYIREEKKQSIVKSEEVDDDEDVDEEALAQFMNTDEDEEEAEARRVAERKAKREAIVAKHKALQKPETTVPKVIEESSSGVKKAGIRFKVTELGLTEDRSGTEVALDMFSAEQDELIVEARDNLQKSERQEIKEVDDEEHHTNWDDVEGYYLTRPGELIAEKYRVLGAVGRGVFSSVLRAVEDTENRSVAIKMIRNNEVMTKAALKEIEILTMLARQDPDDKFHCVRLLATTEHKAHTALIFEDLAMNLRDALNKHGKNLGINIRSVRLYAKQLFLALRHLQKCAVVHADIKPDNILVSENYAALKLCDFGSAFFTSEPCDPAPYLVSRFYRAPEIILGLPYDRRVDLWSVATCLFELYTGRVMFPGSDNNDMLRHIQEVKGRFPVKILKAHLRSYTTLLLRDPHFVEVDATFKFQRRLLDKRTGEPRLNLIDILTPSQHVKDILLENKAGADQLHAVLDLADLLESTLSLNPDHRPQIIDCIKHKFLQIDRIPQASSTTSAAPPPQSSSNGSPDESSTAAPATRVISTSATSTSFLPATLKSTKSKQFR